jgi:hypothetical protein
MLLTRPTTAVSGVIVLLGRFASPLSCADKQLATAAGGLYYLVWYGSALISSSQFITLASIIFSLRTSHTSHYTIFVADMHGSS